jgi:enoyl-CoA hydratase/carnithine racemase
VTLNIRESNRYAAIDLEVEDGIATIWLNRPDRLNAITDPMCFEIVRAFDEIDTNDDVRCVIVTGRGRGFCAGSDLDDDDFLTTRDFQMPRDADAGGVLTRRIFDSAKPVIAAINGAAVGLGITMTLPMDVRLATDSAKIGFVFTRRGLVPEAASAFFLPRLVGISKACEWAFSGRVFQAPEALAAGLVRSIHPADELLSAARELAHELTDYSSGVGVALTRRMLWQMLGDGNPARAHLMDSEAFHYLGQAPDATEGVKSFLEKRDPTFTMRVSQLPSFYERWGRDRGGYDPTRHTADFRKRLRLETRS